MFVPARHFSSAISAAQDKTSIPEFMVICRDASIFRAVAAAIREANGRLNCAPSVARAWDYLVRRKVTGIVIDMGMPGALEMIIRLRTGSGNRSSAIFACMGPSRDTQAAIHAGANFIFHHPLLSDRIARVLSATTELTAGEQRRSFRYPLMVPVEMNLNGRRMHGTMSNLGEGGMAIWSLYYHTPGSEVQFSFELPFGGMVNGTGEVAWTNTEGLAGVKFTDMPHDASAHLNEWINRRKT
jgi:CheY-like chemotaxis protein